MTNKFNGSAKWILVGIAILGGLTTTIGFSYTSHNSATSAVRGMNEIKVELKTNEKAQIDFQRKVLEDRAALDKQWLKTIASLQQTLVELKSINKQLSEITKDHEQRIRELEKY